MIAHSATEIGEQIRSTRKAQGLTQPDLALMANVGVRFIVDMESGKETCQLGLTLRVLQTLGINLVMQKPEYEIEDTDGPVVDFEENESFVP